MPFQMVTLSCRRNFSRSVVIKVFHIYWRSAIHTMPLSQELLQCVLAKPSMQSRSLINLRSSCRSIPHSARIVHTSTHLGVTIAQLACLKVCLQGLLKKRTLEGQLHGPITWQPGSPSVQPHQINSCWYVADTPCPVILGLPSCEGLEVIEMKCTVKVIQDTSQPPSPTAAPPTSKKTAPIKYTMSQSFRSSLAW